jgi:hypothetical protein
MDIGKQLTDRGELQGALQKPIQHGDALNPA